MVASGSIIEGSSSYLLKRSVSLLDNSDRTYRRSGDVFRSSMSIKLISVKLSSDFSSSCCFKLLISSGNSKCRMLLADVSTNMKRIIPLSIAFLKMLCLMALRPLLFCFSADSYLGLTELDLRDLFWVDVSTTLFKTLALYGSSMHVREMSS